MTEYSDDEEKVQTHSVKYVHGLQEIYIWLKIDNE